MDRIGRPRGLIDYATLDDCRREAAGEPARPLLKTVLRPRTLAYFALWGSVGLAMLFALGNRERIDISAQHQRNPAFVQLSDGAVRNGFTVKLRNMQARPREMEVSLQGLPGGVLWSDGGSREAATRTVRTTVPADALAKLPIFVAAPGGGEARQEFAFTVRAADGGESDQVEAVFERPGNGS